MKKAIFFIILFSTLIIYNNKVYAATYNVEDFLNYYNTVIYTYSNFDNKWHMFFSSDNPVINNPNQAYSNIYSLSYIDIISPDDFPFLSGEINGTLHSYSSIYYLDQYNTVIIVKGSLQDFNYSNIENYYPSWNDYSPSDSTSWWKAAWDIIKDYFTGGPFEWISTLYDYISGSDDIPDLYNNIMNDDSGGTSNVIQTPIVPTPIPYTQTLVYDSNNHSYTFIYNYTSESGQNISSPINPNHNNNFNNDYPIIDNYYPNDPLSVPVDNGLWSPQYTLNLDQNHSVDISFNTLNDSFTQGFSDYTDEVDKSSDFMGVIPSSWWLLIGAVSIIPLIAGIINRFLGG